MRREVDLKQYLTKWKADPESYDQDLLDMIIRERIARAIIDATWERVMMGCEDSMLVGILPDNQALNSVTSSDT